MTQTLGTLSIPLQKSTTLVETTALSAMVDKINNILSLHSQNRSQAQGRTLMDFFEQHFNYIKVIKDKLDEKLYMKLYLHMAVEKWDGLTTLFNCGDTGRKMYFIISGEVAILLPTNTLGTEKQSTKTIRTFEDLLKYKLQNYRLLGYKKQFDHFGEIAIEQRIPRTATVVTRTDCVFGIVTYDQYQKVLALYKEHITNQRVQFLEQIPPFKYWNQSALSMLLHSSEDVQFDTNAIIYKKNIVGDSIYIIVQGEIFIQKWDKVKNEGELSEHLISRNYKVTTLGVYSSGQIVGDYELYLTNLKQSKVIRFTQATTKQITKVIKIPIAQYLETIQQTAYSEWMIDYLDKKYTKRWIKTETEHLQQHICDDLVQKKSQRQIQLSKITNIREQTKQSLDVKVHSNRKIQLQKQGETFTTRLQKYQSQSFSSTKLISLMKKRVDQYQDNFTNHTYLGMTIESPKQSFNLQKSNSAQFISRSNPSSQTHIRLQNRNLYKFDMVQE